MSSTRAIGTLAIIRNELRKRQDMINNGQEVEPTTLNGFYYYLRPIFLEHGINPDNHGKLFRRNRTAEITGECKKMYTTREDLLIFARREQHYTIEVKNTELVSKTSKY